MRRIATTLVALAALMPLVLVATGPATARTSNRITLSPHHRSRSLPASATFDTETGTCPGDACDDFPIHLKKVSQKFLRRHHVLLDVLITWTKRADTFGLELDALDPSTQATSYIRSSAADTQALSTNPLVQHVAVWLRPGVQFPRWFDVLVNPGQDEGGYTGKVRLLYEKPHLFFPSAGFTVRNLSLVSKIVNGRAEVEGAGEPSVAIGPDDAIYVSAPVSSPAASGSGDQRTDSGVALFRSTDHGRSWVASNPGSPTGGGDSDVVVDGDNGVYLQDLSLVPSTIMTFKSTDHGETFQPTQPVSADTDREWMSLWSPKGTTTDQTTVYTVYHGFANQNVFFCISGDGGQTNNCNNGITDPTAAANSICNTDQGNVVTESDGDADFLFATSTPAENAGGNQPCLGALHNLYVGHYDRTGTTITNHPVYLGPEGHWITGLFPVLAIDKSDNLYAFWPESPTDAAGNPSGPWSLQLAHSTDGGETWSKPATINPPVLRNNLLNWITVGDDGKIDVIWAGTSAGSSNYDSRAKWYMFLGQSTNGLDAAPTFSYHQITRFPIRYGNICVLGVFCPGDDSRSLLDFAQVEVDRECRANVVFGDQSAYIPALLHRNDVFRGDGTATDWAVQGRTGIRICTSGTGGAGGAGSYTAQSGG
ncbi:MAG: sialidase family protein [Actinomycetota bacterium]